MFESELSQCVLSVNRLPLLLSFTQVLAAARGCVAVSGPVMK